MINLLHFMKLADSIGCMHEELAMPKEQLNIYNILIILNKSRVDCRLTLADACKLQMSINKKLVDISSAVMDEGEIAFFPKAH